MIPPAAARAIRGTAWGAVSATAISAAAEAGKVSAQKTSTGPWPRRSMRRPSTGDAIPAAIEKAAVAAPAIAYEPVALLSRMTDPSGYMATGRRPTNAAAKSRPT